MDGENLLGIAYWLWSAKKRWLIQFAGQSFDIPQASDAEAAAAVEHAKTRGAWTIGETEASDLDYLAQ